MKVEMVHEKRIEFLLEGKGRKGQEERERERCYVNTLRGKWEAIEVDKGMVERTVGGKLAKGC